jgi:uncharacterized protein YdhG (YjbR/CyaY superfamily)
MLENQNAPKVLYHFTSPLFLSSILISKHIALTESNLNISDGNYGVVWLTSSPDSANHGLKFDKTIPVEYDKTSIRITLPYKPAFKLWDEWSDMKGMNKEYKETLIFSANAAETYKTWYISETIIPISDILKVENMATGEIINIKETMKKLPDTKTPVIKCRNVIDQYIAEQPENLQVLLLNVRLTIRETLPDATEKISWGMPTYWQGRNLIHFSAQKNHLGIYPGAEAMKHFTPRLTDYKTSKGAIQFPYKSFGKEQMELIKEIAAWCGEESAKT